MLPNNRPFNINLTREMDFIEQYSPNNGVPIVNKVNESDYRSKLIGLAATAQSAGIYFADIARYIFAGQVHHGTRPANPAHITMNEEIKKQIREEGILRDLIQERTGKSYLNKSLPTVARGIKLPKWVVSFSARPLSRPIDFAYFSEADANIAKKNLEQWASNNNHLTLLTTLPFNLTVEPPKQHPAFPQEQIHIGAENNGHLPKSLRQLFTTLENERSKLEKILKSSNNATFLNILSQYTNHKKEQSDAVFLAACKQYILMSVASNNTNTNMYQNAFRVLEINNRVCELGRAINSSTKLANMKPELDALEMFDHHIQQLKGSMNPEQQRHFQEYVNMKLTQFDKLPLNQSITMRTDLSSHLGQIDLEKAFNDSSFIVANQTVIDPDLLRHSLDRPSQPVPAINKNGRPRRESRERTYSNPKRSPSAAAEPTSAANNHNNHQPNNGAPTFRRK